MQFVDFKHDGKKVSRYGLGCMRLPSTKDEKGDTIIDEPEAIALIRKAIDSGVNYIDTAYVYPGSEAVVGKALKDGYREKVILATKLPMFAVEKKEDLERYYRKQLDTLQVEHIDVYFLHNLYEGCWQKALKFDAIDFMLDLKKQGKISYIAASVHGSCEHFEKVVDAFNWDLVMIQYNYYDKFNQAGQKGLHYASAKGIPVVSMESLHGGLLASNLPEPVNEVFKGFKEGTSPVEKAFMWLYDQPEVTVVLSSASTMEQLEDSLRIFEKAECNILSDSDREVFDKAREAFESIVNINCTACNYCMPCPANVDIPQVFERWNELAKSSDQKWLYTNFLVDTGTDASKCIDCGKCVTLCPQKLDIPCKLKEAHAALAEA